MDYNTKGQLTVRAVTLQIKWILTGTESEQILRKWEQRSYVGRPGGVENVLVTCHWRRAGGCRAAESLTGVSEEIQVCLASFLLNLYCIYNDKINNSLTLLILLDFGRVASISPQVRDEKKTPMTITECTLFTFFKSTHLPTESYWRGGNKPHEFLTVCTHSRIPTAKVLLYHHRSRVFVECVLQARF